MALQGDPVFTKGDRGIGEYTLQFLDTRPLRLGRLHRVRSDDRQVSRMDHDSGVLRCLTKPLLETRRAIHRVSFEAVAGFKRLVRHRRDHFLHRQDAGRLASLLLRCAVLRDPLGDHLFLLRVRRDLGGGLLSATFFTSLEIGAEATIASGGTNRAEPTSTRTSNITRPFLDPREHRSGVGVGRRIGRCTGSARNASAMSLRCCRSAFAMGIA